MPAAGGLAKLIAPVVDSDCGPICPISDYEFGPPGRQRHCVLPDAGVEGVASRHETGRFENHSLVWDGKIALWHPRCLEQAKPNYSRRAN